MDLAGPGEADTPLAPPLPETTWIGPAPDDLVVAPDGDPAQLAQARVGAPRLCRGVAAPARRQRAVLILGDALRWRASEVADLLDLTVAAVNSALQRARATLASRDPGLAQYRDGDATRWAIQALDARDDRIAEITYFLETDGSLFERFGLPPRLPPLQPASDSP